jgi:hypothetical protein
MMVLISLLSVGLIYLRSQPVERDLKKSGEQRVPKKLIDEKNPPKLEGCLDCESAKG